MGSCAGIQAAATKLLPVREFLLIGGYYDLSSGTGKFLFIDNTIQVDSNGSQTVIPRISYVIGNMTKPAVIELPYGALSSSNKGDFKLLFNESGIPNLLNFQQQEGSQIAVDGSIDGVKVSGNCYITSVNPSVYNGTYTTRGGSDTVKLAFSNGDSSITFSDGFKVPQFDYDPIKRRFSYTAPNANGVDFVHRLYINVDAGCGLVIGFVQFNPEDAKNTGSKTYYNLKNQVTRIPAGQTTGAADLGKFAGYYPLSDNGSTFVSIVETDEDNEEKSSVSVGVCTDGTNSTQYSSFTFQSNKLTFPSHGAPTLTFDSRSVSVFLSDGSVLTGVNSFSVAPLLAFGYQTLTTSPNVKNQGKLSMKDAKLTYTLNGQIKFDATDYHYDSVQQAVKDGNVGNYILNFCYNLRRGVTCGVTQTGGGFNNVLYAYL